MLNRLILLFQPLYGLLEKTLLVIVTLAFMYVLVQGVIELLERFGYGQEKGKKPPR